jgi:carbonic anhydrase/acetyltransferase-like protein (isoleucine patch superfamily)
MYKMPGALVLPFNGLTPRIRKGVFLASGSVIVGDVSLGEQTNVWFNTVIRGDVHLISIGSRTNVQDNSTIHVTSNTGPTTIGDDVTIGHNCVIHACKIGNRALIGMGSTVLDGAVIEDECFIAAGSVVPPGKTMPRRMMCMGSPAKPVRPLTESEIGFLKKSAVDYVATALCYVQD